MIKLGSITPVIFSGNGNYCLKYHCNGTSSATLINLKTGENRKLTLTSSIWACEISENAELVATVDEKCNYWVTNTKNNTTKKIMNLYAQLGIDSNNISMPKIYFIDNDSKILSFIHFSQYKLNIENQYIIVTDITTGESKVLFDIKDCFCSQVEKVTNEEFIILMLLRKGYYKKNESAIAKFKYIPDKSFLNYEFSKDFKVSSLSLPLVSFSKTCRYFPAIRLKVNLPEAFGNWCFLDYEEKKPLNNKNAFYYKKSFKAISWLPVENWFLCRFKKDKNFYIGDVLTGEKIAEISFEGFDINVTRYLGEGERVIKTLANKKEFNFTSKSEPINAVYTVGKHKEYLIYSNHKNEYVQDINVLMSFLIKNNQ